VAAIGRAYQPILETTAGEFVQDTTEILDFIEPRHPEPSVYPAARVSGWWRCCSSSTGTKG
jgi:hypothetical protein